MGDGFISVLNWCLPFIQTDEDENAVWEEWASIGVGRGKSFDFGALTPEEQNEIQIGVQSAIAKIKETVTVPAQESP